MTTHPPKTDRRQLLKTLGAGGALAATPSWFNIASAQGGPIKIGFPVPLTGAFSRSEERRVGKECA